MKSNQIEIMKRDVQRYMAEISGPAIHDNEQKIIKNKKVEPVAVALLLEAYLLFSNNGNPENAVKFIQNTSENIELIRDQMIHDQIA